MPTYANLEQRMVRSYVDMLPPCVPLTSAPVAVASQEQFYAFWAQAYQALYDAPQALFAQLHPDDAYPNRFNRASYGQPKLIDQMRSAVKVIDGLIAWLYAVGQTGAVVGDRLALPAGARVKQQHLAALPALGLALVDGALTCPRFPGLFDAWRWLATRPGATALAFSRCEFDPAYPYLQDVYARLFGDAAAFQALAEHLVARGYARLATARGPYTLDYVKSTVPHEVPLGVPMHGDRYHYGLSADYRYDATEPQYLVVRILDMKGILQGFAALSENLQAFVIRQTKPCDDCGYCTQTDKTGKRQPLAIAVDYRGQRHLLCPLYPGFSFSFSAVDAALAATLREFLDFEDAHLSQTR